MADQVTIKDQYMYLIQEAASISQEEKDALIAALNQGMTPELKEQLIALFETEEAGIDRSIETYQDALNFYKEEMNREKEEAAPTVSHLDELAATEMHQVSDAFQTTALKLESEYEKAVEGDARESDNAQADAIRAQLGVQGK